MLGDNTSKIDYHDFLLTFIKLTSKMTTRNTPIVMIESSTNRTQKSSD
jgi:hypothetical protein